MQYSSISAVPMFITLLLSSCNGSGGDPIDSAVGGNAAVGGATTVNSGGTPTSQTGGATNVGSGGVPGTGGTPSTGGTPASGGTAAPRGGAPSTGGAPPTGGTTATGGKASGGSPSIGGLAPTAGAAAAGGRASGGSPSTGGILSSGGTSMAGGGKATGGAPSSGGTTSAGGMPSNGGSGTSGGAATGGTGAYRPCPTNGDPCKILPLGDSITWGIGYDGAYRVELFSKAVAASKKITFTGSVSNGPATVSGTTFPQRNEGHSGWTIAQDSGLIPSPALDTSSGGIPHIVLVHIGTNDVYAASGQATMPDRLGALIDKVTSAAPNALVVVAKITPLSNASWNNTVNTYNNAIPGVVQTRAAAGKHVILADMNTGFTAGMLSTDGVHPNQSGYNFMGDQWYSVISGLLQ